MIVQASLVTEHVARIGQLGPVRNCQIVITEHPQPMAAFDEGSHAGPGKRWQACTVPEHVDGRFVAHCENSLLRPAFPGCPARQVAPNITWAACGSSTGSPAAHTRFPVWTQS